MRSNYLAMPYLELKFICMEEQEKLPYLEKVLDKEIIIRHSRKNSIVGTIGFVIGTLFSSIILLAIANGPRPYNQALVYSIFIIWPCIIFFPGFLQVRNLIYDPVLLRISNKGLQIKKEFISWSDIKKFKGFYYPASRASDFIYIRLWNNKNERLALYATSLDTDPKEIKKAIEQFLPESLK